MSAADTGGPAFPGIAEYIQNEGGFRVVDGMTLRDYFAAHAPITLQDAIDWLDVYGGGVVRPWQPKLIMNCLIELRRDYADAMIAARK